MCTAYAAEIAPLLWCEVNRLSFQVNHKYSLAFHSIHITHSMLVLVLKTGSAHYCMSPWLFSTLIILLTGKLMKGCGTIKGSYSYSVAFSNLGWDPGQIFKISDCSGHFRTVAAYTHLTKQAFCNNISHTLLSSHTTTMSGSLQQFTGFFIESIAVCEKFNSQLIFYMWLICGHSLIPRPHPLCKLQRGSGVIH